MNVIRYEPVFGDQSLFDNASDDAVLAIKDTTSGRIHFFTNKGWIKSGLKHERHIGTSDNEIAMRRIIKEPKRWTQADKDAGRLPDVGCKCRQGSKDEIVVAVTGKFVVTECQDMSVCTTRKDVFMRSYNPIETPAEKARRERDEWAKKASEFIDDELDCVNLVGEHVMRRFYNAMLSGELPMPKKGGE